MYLFGGIWAVVGTIFLVTGLVGFLNADSQPAFLHLMFTGLGGLFAAIGYTLSLIHIYQHGHRLKPLYVWKHEFGGRYSAGPAYDWLIWYSVGD